MTRRERMERRLQRRLEWAEKRRLKADSLLARNKPFEGDWAFNTQPGHIPERARAIRRSENAYEHTKVAHHHESKADGLELQLAQSIFSDDPDAIERLREKSAAITAEADRWVAINREARKGPGWATRAKLTDEERAELLRWQRFSPGGTTERKPVPSYHITNLRANARRLHLRALDLQGRDVLRQSEALLKEEHHDQEA